MDELPAEPGIILIRGPRQFGKSTWLELELKRTEYLFTGVSHKDFHAQFRDELGDDVWKAYLLSGGSPIAAVEIRQRERVPEVFRASREHEIDFVDARENLFAR